MTRADFRFVFIVTYARSGSTLLQSLLNATPGVLIRGENFNAPFHLYRSVAALSETHSRYKPHQKPQPRTVAPDTPFFGAGDIRVGGFRDRVLDSFVEEVLAPPAGTRVLGFKEVRHIPSLMSEEEFHGYMDFLLEHFPGARVICNSRAAEKVANSGFLKERNTANILRNVHTADTWFHALCARSERCLHMQHEAYTAEPARLEELFSFLDLPYDSARVQSVLDKPLTHAQGGQRPGGGT